MARLSFLRSALTALVFALLLPFAALAQDPAGPDYAQWDGVAARAEEAIDAARASSAAFEDLRTQVVVWRQTFLAAQTARGPRGRGGWGERPPITSRPT